MNQALSATTARIAQAVWVVLAVAGTVINVVFTTSQWTTLDNTCHIAATCSNGQLDASAARTLSHYGISINAFAVFTMVSLASILALLYGLGALIIWRRREDRGAIVAAFFLVAFPLSLNFPLPWTFAALIFFGLLFPDGRFAPRWTRWLALATVVACIFSVFSVGLATLATLVLILPAPFLQIFRFRTTSSWTQRQRTKWAVLGLAATILGFIAIITSFAWAPWQTAGGSLYAGLMSRSGFSLAISALPISLAVSVLRNRLWDIDRVISRALAYATLTLTIGGIYVGGVIGLQALIGLMAGNSSGPAIVLSTLAIAALFGPLRRRIQVGIDRRFYRNKYDAARTVAAFGEGLRDEVDLSQLSSDLTSVIHEALHPAHVSLWLRDGGHALLAPPTLPQRGASGDTL